LPRTANRPRARRSSGPWVVLGLFGLAVAAFVSSIFFIVYQHQQDQPDSSSAQGTASPAATGSDMGKGEIQPAVPPIDDNPNRDEEPNAPPPGVFDGDDSDNPFEDFGDDVFDGNPLGDDDEMPRPDGHRLPPNPNPFAPGDDFSPLEDDPELKAEREAEALALLKQAEAAISKKDLDAAIALFLRCMNDLPPAEQFRASQLLEQTRLAHSADNARNAARQLTREQRRLFELGRLEIRPATPFIHPKLAEAFHDNIRKQLAELKKQEQEPDE